MEIENPNNNHYLFTSESVTEGHPDKICDIISDSILDECLKQDPYSKVAIETVTKSNNIILAGEITTKAKINYEDIVKTRLGEIGYNSDSLGINSKNVTIIKEINEQSKEISDAVHDQKKFENIGVMFGYATNETKELFPFSHLMALKLSLKLTEVRKKKEIKNLRPDGKTQVTVEYKEEKGKMIPLKVKTVLISAQHEPDTDIDNLKEDIKHLVIEKVIPNDKIDKNTIILINPGGDFVLGGPEANAGLTGRRIIVDTYGGWGSHGGGAFSGKDPTKVHRSGAYAARWIAKSLVEEKLCDRVLVQLSYSSGETKPLSILVNSYGTVKNNLSDGDLVNIVKDNFDLGLSNIINELKLREPIYSKTACGGHFGREEKEFLWEKPKKLITKKYITN